MSETVRRNERAAPGIIRPKGQAMWVNSIPVDVVGEAYQIAAYYLEQTGRLPRDVDLHRPLLDSIVEDFRAGKRSKLVLANRAIARFEKTNDVLELAR
jgi:hypothetical protein